MKDKQVEQQARRMTAEELAKSGRPSKERIDKDKKLFVGTRGRVQDIHELIDGLVNPKAKRI